ncbi:MAG: aspartate aminotransferase family protein [Chloroflexi bacterium]|nr:aspartate aminotransferase family protein [Chloroflexota bacterium]
MDDWDALLDRTARIAREWLASVDERRVFPDSDAEALRAGFPQDLPEEGEDPTKVIEDLARAATPGLVASPGPRYFGFVIGGSVPASVAADWLTSAWDQNAGLYVSSPASSLIEEIAARSVLELSGLPRDAGVGFATGATMANFACLAAARSKVLDAAGWDVEANGLVGAPPVRLIVGEEVHATATYALRLLGFGGKTAVRIPVDANGAMQADALREALADPATRDRPTIVAAQAGNVNTGAFDPLGEIADAVHGLPNAWLHVDGAFGFWAAAAPTLSHLTAGMERADSWTTDAHKWLNVPYDCGIAIVREPTWLARSMALTAAYLLAADRERDPYDWVAEGSRRARGTTVYAAIRSLGRRGLAELIERDCALARRFAASLHGRSGIRILNDVVLNQVLVRFDDPAEPGDVAAGDARTKAVIAAVQRDGTMWAGGTSWHGLAAMRISVSNWRTTEADVDRSVDSILRAATAATKGKLPAV